MPSVALSQKALATTSTCYFCVSPDRRRPKSANQWDGDAMDRQPRKTARSNAFESSVARWECDDDGARDRDETRLRARVIDRRSARQRHSQSRIYPGRRNLYCIVGDGEVDFRALRYHRQIDGENETATVHVRQQRVVRRRQCRRRGLCSPSRRQLLSSGTTTCIAPGTSTRNSGLGTSTTSTSGTSTSTNGRSRIIGDGRGRHTSWQWRLSRA